MEFQYLHLYVSIYRTLFLAISRHRSACGGVGSAGTFDPESQHSPLVTLLSVRGPL